MNTFPNLRARYSNGILKLSKKLKLPDGAEVYVSVKPVGRTPRKSAKPASSRKPTKWRKSKTISLKPGTIRVLIGAISVGGDALQDSESIYDTI